MSRERSYRDETHDFRVVKLGTNRQEPESATPAGPPFESQRIVKDGPQHLVTPADAPDSETSLAFLGNHRGPTASAHPGEIVSSPMTSREKDCIERSSLSRILNPKGVDFARTLQGGEIGEVGGMGEAEEAEAGPGPMPPRSPDATPAPPGAWETERVLGRQEPRFGWEARKNTENGNSDAIFDPPACGLEDGGVSPDPVEYDSFQSTSLAWAQQLPGTHHLSEGSSALEVCDQDDWNVEGFRHEEVRKVARSQIHLDGATGALGDDEALYLSKLVNRGANLLA
jgi:hypothetical protein